MSVSIRQKSSIVFWRRAVPLGGVGGEDGRGAEEASMLRCFGSAGRRD